MAPGEIRGRETYVPDSDLSFLEAASEEFEGYLLSKEAYWRMPTPRGQAPLPFLSLGGLLLARARLGTLEGSLSAADADRLRRSASRLDALRARWESVVERKIVQEAKSHVNLWRSYLEDLAESPRPNLEEYPREVRERVLLSLLATQRESVRLDAAHRSTVAGLDQQLRSWFREGEFLWDPRLKPAFSRSDFWFLYGRPEAR
jgi:hypothetical protein